MGWRSLLTLGLLLVALLTTWATWQGREPAPLADLLAQRSDYVLYDFDLVNLNAEGKEVFTLSSPQLRQTPGGRALELNTPVFLLPQGETRHWQVHAASGWVSANSDEIRLRGGVVATPLDDASGQIRIETETLDLFPQQELASTGSDVTLTRPGATMRGTGMRAHLDQNRVELLSNVTLRHTPFSR